MPGFCFAAALNSIHKTLRKVTEYLHQRFGRLASFYKNAMPRKMLPDFFWLRSRDEYCRKLIREKIKGE